MQLILLSPTKTLFDGEIDSVTIPGTKGLFTVLPHHAPLITTTEKGTITYKTIDGEHNIQVSDGFAEIKNNIVSICIEKLMVE
ncbi:MAG: F0F1 ATP synthase subunit epsilon [Bacteroidales bacterium]|nr:F0F1 ATP synthase subunit epsilon [Bacteroidales bacterium]